VTRANYMHIHGYLDTVLIQGVPGDMLECGVWYGTTFMPMAEQAKIHRRVAHAVDSFRGMAEPTPEDGGEYPAGALSVGGSGLFRMLAAPYGSIVQVHEGWIPRVLCEMADCQFAFAHLDVDQYLPTLHCLQWLAPRLSPGAMFAVHDYFPGRKNTMATQAVRDWINVGDAKAHGIRLLTHARESNHAVFVRT